MPVQKPDKIILHCSATPDKGDDFGAEQINQWHKKRGFRDDISNIHTGYHFVIRRSGIVESFHRGDECRPETSIGAHVRGHNTNSIGVCFIGEKKITLDQLNSWMNLYSYLKVRWGIGIDKVFGHNEFSIKDCPGFSPHLMRLFMERELD